MYRAKTDLRNNSPLQLYMKASLVLKRMTNNPNFVNPTPTMPDFSQAINKLKVAMIHADTAPAGFHKRDEAVRELTKMYRELASYITWISSGEPSIILSSGFGVNKKKSKIYITEAPLLKPVKKLGLQGMVKLSWSVVPKNFGYIIRLYDMDQPGKMIDSFVSAKSSFIITGLQSGKKYAARVSARGRRGEGPMSSETYIWENWM